MVHRMLFSNLGYPIFVTTCRGIVLNDSSNDSFLQFWELMILRKLFPFEVIQSISTDDFSSHRFQRMDITWHQPVIEIQKQRHTTHDQTWIFDGILIFLFSERLVKWARDPNHLPKMVDHKSIVGNLVMLFDCKWGISCVSIVLSIIFIQNSIGS